MNARCESITPEQAATREPGSEDLGPSIGALTDMVNACLGADACLIAIERAWPQRSQVYGMPQAGSAAGRAAVARVAQALLDLPAEPMVLSSLPNRGRTTHRTTAALAAVTRLLKVSSVVCLPLRLPTTKARLCIATARDRYTQKDVRALMSLARQASTILEAILFGERLAIELARQERRQISRDLHDSAIQPYIGLKLGLEALRRRLGKDHQLLGDVDELITIAAAGIGELRQYVGALKTSAAKRKSDCLISAARSEARKFGALYGIEATVVAAGDISVTAPMQHEVIQMIREGLSNIRRHTTANHAAIHLRQEDGKLVLEIINDNEGRAHARCRFSPRSIGERAMELGGRVQAGRRGRRTVVAVELPL